MIHARIGKKVACVLISDNPPRPEALNGVAHGGGQMNAGSSQPWVEARGFVRWRPTLREWARMERPIKLPRRLLGGSANRLTKHHPTTVCPPPITENAHVAPDQWSDSQAYCGECARSRHDRVSKINHLLLGTSAHRRVA